MAIMEDTDHFKSKNIVKTGHLECSTQKYPNKKNSHMAHKNHDTPSSTSACKKKKKKVSPVKFFTTLSVTECLRGTNSNFFFSHACEK